MDPSHVIRCQACDATVDTKTARKDGDTTCPQCGAALAVFSEDTVAPGTAANTAEGDDGFVDLQIPGYEIKRQIGRGGMGFVFEARQTSLDRSVAIKVLAPHLGNDPQFAARFEAEAAALARLAHPNIVSIYERGRCGDRLYFVMEFVAGDAQGRPVDLKSVIARGPLDDAEARRIIVQVIRALSVAHTEGIVHRDVKPGNILLDRHGNAKVADFGIACFGDAPDRERFTQPAAAMGTYDYMAPEQRADAATSDARADIYSTAAMLYEMLTGRVAAGAFQPPSAARPGVHTAWDAIIARGMHPLRDERFPSMIAFIGAVEELAFAPSHPADSVRGPVTASPGVRCHECEQVVREDAQFCPACRTPQFLNCKSCGALMRAALNGCEKCGADLQNQRRYERFFGLGTAALNRARAADSVADRLQAAQEAGVALARARKATDDNSSVAPLLTEANRIVETLAAKAAGDAIREKRLGDAVELLDAVLDVAPGRTDAERLRTKLTNERDRAVTEATQLRDAGKPQQAVAIFRELAKRFASDASVGQLLRDCERRATGLKAVVRDTVPALMAEKKWCAVEAIVRQLRAEGAQVAGLDELEARVVAILGSVSRAVAQADAAAAAGDFVQAARATEVVLAKVADHPRALEVQAVAESTLGSLRDATGRLKATLEEGRWFSAKRVVSEMPAAAHSRSAVREGLGRAHSGIERANRYATVLIVALSGATSMMVAAIVAGAMHNGLTNAFRSLEMGSALFGYRWPAAFTLLAVPLCVGLCVAVAVAAALRRGVDRRMLAAAGTAVPLFCLTALFFATDHRWDSTLGDVLQRLGSVSPIGFPSLQTLKASAANVALWGGYALAIAACLSGIRGPSGASTWRAAVSAGLIAAIAAICGPRDSSSPASGLNSALLVAAVTVFTARADSKFYLAALSAAGLLGGGLTSVLDYRMKWLGPVLSVLAVLVAQIAFTRPRSVAAWFADALLVAGAIFGAAYLQRPLLWVHDTISIAPDTVLIAWFLAAGVLAMRWAKRREVDRRLHITDRLASRQWAVRPASGPI